MNSAYDINPTLIIQKLNNSLSIYNPTNSTFYTFNEIAQFIMNKILDQKQKKEVVEALTRRYDVSLIDAKRDVDTFTQKLRKSEIILEK